MGFNSGFKGLTHLCALQCRTLQFGDPLPSVMCTPCISQSGFM